MKIPTNPPGSNPAAAGGPDRSAEPRRGSGAAHKPVDSRLVPEPTGHFPALANASRLGPNPSWHRAQLENPEACNQMIEESVQMLVASSPFAPRFSADQLAQLARCLAGDPVLRELITQHLEQGLV